MPPLENERQEKFAIALFQGKQIKEAYVEAGFAEHHSAAYALAASKPVQARVKDLQQRLATKVVVTQTWVIEKLTKIVAISLGDEEVELEQTTSADGGPEITIKTRQTKIDLPAATRALELIGKQLGMFTDKKELEIKVIHLTSDKPMTQEDWAKAYADNVRLSATDTE